MQTLDQSTGVVFPLYDHDTFLLLLTGKEFFFFCDCYCDYGCGCECAAACDCGWKGDSDNTCTWPAHHPTSAQGDGNIRFYELAADAQLWYELQGVVSSEQHRAVCLVPKRGLDVMNTEVIRLLKLTSNAIVPVSFQVPRKVS
jgi:hypothetical protein